MKILICGMGSIGNRHFECLRTHKGIEIWALRSYISGLESKNVADKTFHHVNEIENIQELDGVIIANPTSLHVETAIKFAQQGVPLLIEKPLGHNFDNVPLLARTCRTLNIPVLMGNNLMHHPGVVNLEKLLANKVIGETLSSRAQFGTYMPDWHPGENYKDSYASIGSLGGGATLTSIHEINYITSFFGDVESLMALEIKKNVLNIDVEEGVEILLKHINGIVSSINLNFFQIPNRRYCEIVGTNGTIHWNFWEPNIKIRYKESEEIITMGDDALSLLNESYQAQMDHFLDMCKGIVKSKVPLHKGISDLQIAFNVLQQINRR
jgi:predicted dehydrogenase